MAKMTTKDLVRFSYVNLIEAKTAPGATEAKFGMSIIIPKTATKTIEAVNAAIVAATKEGVEKHGSKWKAKKLPLRDGDEEREDDAYKGAFFLNVNSKNRPALFDKDVQKIFDPAEIISGDWGHVGLNFYAFNVNGNSGIAVGLNSVQKCKDGDPLGGSASDGSEFGNFQEAEEQY